MRLNAGSISDEKKKSRERNKVNVDCLFIVYDAIKDGKIVRVVKRERGKLPASFASTEREVRMPEIFQRFHPPSKFISASLAT